MAQLAITSVLTQADPDLVINGFTAGASVETITAQLSGTFDGATVEFQVSEDGITYETSQYSDGNDISRTTAGGMTCLTSNYRGWMYYRFHASSAGSSTAVTVNVSGDEQGA